MRGIALVVASLWPVVAIPQAAHGDCDKPSLLLILDKSSSMVTGSVPSGITKWEAARRAVSAITTRFDESINFGLLVFPNPDRCNVTGVAVPIGERTASAIARHLATPPPSGGNWTPMYQALQVATAYPPMSDTSKRRVAVLITDGWQWCDPYDPATRFEPVEHAAALRATGTTLHVVGFGDGVDAATLNRIAYESGTHIAGCDPTGDTPTAPNPCYRFAEDTGPLESILEGIARLSTEEVCDRIDNDCDGQTDEDLRRACSTICGDGTETCVGGSWTGCTAPTPADEVCEGRVDEDCDGVTDEGCRCTEGETRACGPDVGACRPGTQRCSGGLWSECEGAVWPTTEECNGVDDDCNGLTDDWATCPPGQTCRSGVCIEAHVQPEEPEEPTRPTGDDAAGAGCGCALAGDAGTTGLLAGSLLALLLLVVRRR